jgi:hypothetical protein
VPYSRHGVTVRSGQAGAKAAGFGGFAEVTRRIAGDRAGLVLADPAAGHRAPRPG